MRLPDNPDKAARIQRMGAETLDGTRRQGWFIPYRYADQTPPPPRSYPALMPWFQASHDMFSDVIARMEHYAEALHGFDGTTPPLPRWQQDWFPRADGAAAYTLVRDLQPRQIMEVGSGHSTRFMARAVLDAGLDCQITCIDPAPRADIAGLAPVSLHQSIVQDLPPADLPQLEAGDILFIDSSHISMPGSDVDHLFLSIIPSLPAGAILQVHDICLPLGYPESWEWRGYNEHAALAPLIHGGGWELIWASHYVINCAEELWSSSILADLHCPDGSFETSLWLRKLG
ncbi:MAG: class I SAM-dependent methyltransferase [Alphaproteobacteria bacterium]